VLFSLGIITTAGSGSGVAVLYLLLFTWQVGVVEEQPVEILFANHPIVRIDPEIDLLMPLLLLV
jgi:hypothetical protein